MYKHDNDLAQFFSIGIYIFIFAAALFVHNKDAALETDSNVIVPPQKESSSKKMSTYLQGVDDIENADELREFYYKIASDFYNNEMGLKGTQEQIKAGNKVMSDVYGFLGISLSKGKIQNTDSIKAVIQKNTIISSYRKKKAIEELELGVEKIQSFQ